MRTRAQINSAFVMLLHSRSYDHMRVSDITRKAGVGRATFYAHFTSKDDLLRSQVERVVLPMLRVRAQEAYLLDCRAFFEHVLSAKFIYKALMGGRERGGARVIRDVFEGYLGSVLTVASGGVNRDIPEAVVTRFVVTTLIGVAAHGLSSGGAVGAEEMQRLFEKLVGTGLGA